MSPGDYLRLYQQPLCNVNRENVRQPDACLSVNRATVNSGHVSDLLILAARSELIQLIEEVSRAGDLMSMSEVRQRFAEFGQLEKEVLELNERMLALSSKNDEVYAQLQHQEGINAQQIEELRLLRTEAAMSRSLQEVEKRLSDRMDASDQIAAQYIAIQESMSWKVTAIWRLPLMWLKRRVAQSHQQIRSGVFRRRFKTAVEVLRYQGVAAFARLLKGRLSSEFRPPEPAEKAAYPHGYRAAAAIEPLDFPYFEHPLLKVCIIADDRHLRTFTCLKSISNAGIAVPFEIAVLDVSRAGLVKEALAQVTGIDVVHMHGHTVLGGNLAAFLNARNGSGYILVLHNACQLGELAVKELLRTMDDGIAMVGGKSRSREGTSIRDACGVLTRDGRVTWLGKGEAEGDSSYNYRREVDVCSMGFCLLRQDVLHKPFDACLAEYASLDYVGAELGMRFREAGMRVVYQPLAVAVFDSAEDSCDGSPDLERDREHFRSTWEWELSTVDRAPENPARLHKVDAGKRILVLDAVMLTPDQDSGSLRMWYLLGILRDLGAHVAFLPSNVEDDGSYGDDLRRSGIEVLCHPQITSAREYLQQNARQYDTLIISRLVVADQFMDLVRHCAPDAFVVYDTVDLHFLREQRQAELEDSDKLRGKAGKTKQAELSFMRKADLTYVVSPEEKRLLEEEVSDVRIEVLSNIHSSDPTKTPFEDRRDILFIGGFRHPPNVDAMLWFATEIMPLLRQRLDGFTFYIIGSNVPPEIKALSADDVVVTGFIEDVRPYFEKSRLSVSPLRYGAGVKGKINMSMAYGVPVVATPISIEGMNLTHGYDVLVADGAADFANAVIQLYADPQVWKGLAEGGLENIHKHFSIDTARTILVSTLMENQCRK